MYNVIVIVALIALLLIVTKQKMEIEALKIIVTSILQLLNTKGLNVFIQNEENSNKNQL